jgi:hypothetical protein|tara:strand:+ start:386 stop:538 length:153 start_codon:yes stop_codon:yes gene_type:complete
MEDDYTLIDYSLHKPAREDYKDWHIWFEDYCAYIVLKYRDTYGSKEKKEA